MAKRVADVGVVINDGGSAGVRLLHSPTAAACRWCWWALRKSVGLFDGKTSSATGGTAAADGGGGGGGVCGYF